MNLEIETMMEIICLQYIQERGNEEEGELTSKIASTIPNYDFLNHVTPEDVLKYLVKKYL